MIQANPSASSKQRRIFHWAFEVGVILKGVNGALETIGGLLLVFTPTTSISRWLIVLSQGELSEDPQDLLAGALLHLSQNLTSSVKFFGALYLLSHGVIKIGLVVALLKKKMWAYPASITFLVCFIIYQFYRLYESYTIGMTALTLLDFIVLYLIWKEYRSVTSDPKRS